MHELPKDTSCQAEYEDGFILDETEQGDISPYAHLEQVNVYDDDGNLTGFHMEPVTRNILRAILEKRPEDQHGKMVRFTVFYKDRKYDIDWTTLPANARPIRFRDGRLTKNMETGEETFCWSGCRFGYQYTDENGRNVQEVQDL